MTWLALDTWIVIVGVLCAVACALPGCFMVLRRMSMMSDAISHAVLPGLAAAFLTMIWIQNTISNNAVAVPEWLNSILMLDARSTPVMFVGAAIVGVLTAVITQIIHRHGNVESSAAMGVVFTTLFALGLILIQRGARAVDLDPGCVLYGAIELTYLDQWNILGMNMPRAAVVLGIVAALNALFTIVFYKELKISSFDPDLATTLGINANVMHYLLMAQVAITAVAAFEVVGSILVVAMLIVPAATAHLLTDRLPRMLIVSVIVAAFCAAVGHISAITLPGLIGFPNTSTNSAAMMAVMLGVVFGLTLIAAPRYGLISRILARTSLQMRITREDILGVLYRLEELDHRDPQPASFTLICNALDVSRFNGRRALRGLIRTDRLREQNDVFSLTESGRTEARQLVRSHRLWELYLAKHFDLPLDHLHAPAEHLEHVTDAAMQQKLAAGTVKHSLDPHGRKIPEDEPMQEL